MNSGFRSVSNTDGAPRVTGQLEPGRSRNAFDESWKTRRESFYNHWSRGTPRNQIQLAFRSHWLLFREILGSTPPGRSLEVGAGRGSISSYFSDAGWETVLLDYSHQAMKVAQEIFRANGHRATFLCADGLVLPLANASVNLVTSIGLLEHFMDIETALDEQLRVLAPGGWFLAYVVPVRPENIQRYFLWLNWVLKVLARLSGAVGEEGEKPDLFRSDDSSERYLEILRKRPVDDLQAFGVYPMPMISHSPKFPFSLLPAPLELVLVQLFRTIQGIRRLLFTRNPWICREGFGQAFVVVARKKGVRSELHP